MNAARVEQGAGDATDRTRDRPAGGRPASGRSVRSLTARGADVGTTVGLDRHAFSLRSPCPPIGGVLAVACRRTCPAGAGSTRELLHTRPVVRAIAATHSCCLINRTEADRRAPGLGKWI